MVGISRIHPLGASQGERTGEWLRWRVQPAGLVLSESTVHVWAFALWLSSRERESLEQILSTDEQVRAASLKNLDVRNRFVTSRIRLRQLLGQFLGRHPSDILFEYGAYGKPVLAQEVGRPPVMFNLAHSGDVGLVALRMNQPVGIDLEKKKRVTDDFAIAKRFFSPAEFHYIQSLPSSQRGEAFLRIWTCKEAYVKATGLGLSCSLDSFEVFCSSDSRKGQIVPLGDSGPKLEYAFQLLPSCTTFLGAVASVGHNWNLNYWQLPDILES